MNSMLEGLNIDDVTPVEVGPGCYRRDLLTSSGVSAWLVDMDPGSQWPHVDHHDEHGEHLFVVSGELIEGDERFVAGTYVRYGPNSSHQPRTDVGVRLFGFNVG